MYPADNILLMQYQNPDIPLFFEEDLIDYFTLPEPVGMRMYVSPSSLNTFIICPAKFLWDKVLKLDIEEHASPSAEIGTAVHSWAEDYMVKVDRNTMRSQIQDFEKQGTFGKYKANLIRAELQLPETNPVGQELKLKSHTNKRNGYLDRVDRRTGTDELLITDYKPYAKMNGHTKRQLVFYAAQLNYMIQQGEIDIAGVVTHARIAGYKDGKNEMIKIKKQSITAMEKQIKKLREATHFPCNINQPACRFCKFADNLCLEANYESV